MDISEIGQAGSVRQIHKKEGVHSTQVVDRLSISSESEKKAAWVEMLKEMPDIRPDKVEGAGCQPLSSQQLAEEILNS